MRGLTLVLVHIPKTAGTTLGSLLGHHYGARYRRVDMSGVHVQAANGGFEVFRHGEGSQPERLERFVLEPGVEAVSGHVPVGLLDLLPRAERYVTILRDPVERTLSQYYHLVARTGAWRHEWLPAPTPELSFSDAVGERRYIQDNLQTRMLCGLASVDDPLPADALERAKQNLRGRFSHVGTTERCDELVALLNVELGWPTIAYERARVNVARPRGRDVPPEAVRAAEEANELDRELHVEAGRLQDEALGRAGAEVEVELGVLRRAQQRSQGEPGVDLRSLSVEARIELAAKEAELLASRTELLDAARRYAKRTEQWRELKRVLRRGVRR
jgi:hypothetical protein